MAVCASSELEPVGSTKRRRVFTLGLSLFEAVAATCVYSLIPHGHRGEDAHKHRVETETEVGDGDVLAQVFKSLGLVAAFRYEKWRSEWTDDEGHCVIDETPIGDYAELEGSAEWIDRTAARIGVDRAA